MNKMKIYTGVPGCCEPINIKCKYVRNHTNQYKECCRDCSKCEWSDVSIKFNEDNIPFNKLLLIRDSVDRQLNMFHRIVNHVDVLKFIASKGTELADTMDKLTLLYDYNSVSNKKLDIDFDLLYVRLFDVYSKLAYICSNVNDKHYCDHYARFNEFLSLLNSTIDKIFDELRTHDKDYLRIMEEIIQ